MKSSHAAAVSKIRIYAKISLMEQEQIRSKKSNFSIPISIIIAGGLVAGAIYFSKSNPPPPPNEAAVVSSKIVVKPVSQKDHILGSPNSAFVLVEFSDTECPFCKSFHSTLTRALDEYGKSGKFAWVYRHFPLEQLHKLAPREAEATECAAEYLGNDGFWSYINKIYEVTPSNDGLDPKELMNFARDLGVDEKQFEECLNGGRYKEFVKSQYDEAITAGGRGTPFNVVVLKKPLSKNEQQDLLGITNDAYASLSQGSILPPDLFRFDEEGKIFTFSGALPYEIIKAMIDFVIK